MLYLWHITDACCGYGTPDSYVVCAESEEAALRVALDEDETPDKTPKIRRLGVALAEVEAGVIDVGFEPLV